MAKTKTSDRKPAYLPLIQVKAQVRLKLTDSNFDSCEREAMAQFRVQCFRDGEWDDQPFLEIEAESPEQAAVLACGGPVRTMVGRKDELRARVWPKDKDRPEFLFFAPHSP